jgi:hypothetical protein
MLFIFSTPELNRYLLQLKKAIFLHWCLICAIPFGGDVSYFAAAHSRTHTLWVFIEAEQYTSGINRVISGLYYKHVMIVNDDSSTISK